MIGKDFKAAGITMPYEVKVNMLEMNMEIEISNRELEEINKK